MLVSLFVLYTVTMARWSLCVFLLLLSCDVALMKKKKKVQTLSRGKIIQSPKYNPKLGMYFKPVCIVNITILSIRKSRYTMSMAEW